MQDLDELKHIFLICAEFEMKKTSVHSFYKENNFKPCLTKQLLNMFKLWCERGIRFPYLILNLRESTTLGSGKTKAKFIRKQNSWLCEGRICQSRLRPARLCTS